MAAVSNWVTDFKLNQTLSQPTLSEVRRFLEVAVVNPPFMQQDGADRLAELIQSADLHFTVDDDPLGHVVRNTLEDIATQVLGPNEPQRRFWLNALFGLCLTMATRLAVYRQEVDPSPTLTQNLQRFVTGLRGFILLHQAEISLDVEERWKDVVQQIHSDRTKVLATQQRWQNKVMRLVMSPLIQIRSVAHELKKTRNRKAHARYTLAQILELQLHEISSLSILRQRLETSLDDASIHRSRSHLFTAKTYVVVTPNIDAALRSRGAERGQTLLLLQKRFELMGLHEIRHVLSRAIQCYKTMGNVMESTVQEPKERCLVCIEQIIDLLWLQQQSINVKHSDVVVDLMAFRRCVRALVRLGDPIRSVEPPVTPLTPPIVLAAANERAAMDADQSAIAANADMWRPSLLKLEDVIRTGHLTVDSIELVYDMIMVPTYTAAPYVQAGGADDDPEPPGPLAFAQLRTSLHSGVMQQRDVVRALRRQVDSASAALKRKAMRVDRDMDLFVRFVLTPFLVPIDGQWRQVEEAYLKPMTADHEDMGILTGADNKARDRAIERSAPQRLNNVAASLSSSSIVVLQVIKVSRLFIQIGAAFVAQKVFNESYVRKVFSEGRDPPKLSSMLFLMLSIDATAHLMLIILLVLSSFAFKTATNTYIVDDLFLAEVLAEFALSSLVLIVIGMMVADTLRRKRYFQYADQGQIVSVAYRTALLYLCVINFVIPYSVLVS